MSDTADAAPKPKRRLIHEIHAHATKSGRGLTLQMPTRKAMEDAFDKISDALKNGLGVVEIATNRGAASIDTGQIWAVSRQSYWVTERDFSDDF